MAKAQNKTTANAQDPRDFIMQIEHPTRRAVHRAIAPVVLASQPGVDLAVRVGAQQKWIVAVPGPDPRQQLPPSRDRLRF